MPDAVPARRFVIGGGAGSIFSRVYAVGGRARTPNIPAALPAWMDRRHARASDGREYEHRLSRLQQVGASEIGTRLRAQAVAALRTPY